MRRVSSTEVQNNFGNYLLVAQEQDLIITRNGKDVAKLSGLISKQRKRKSEDSPSAVSEKFLSSGYGLKTATYEEFLELTKEETLQRYEYIDGEIFLQDSAKLNHQVVLGKLAAALSNFFAEKSCFPLTAPFDIRISRHEGDLNVVQPDVMVICDLEGNLGDDGYYYGIPDLVMEIMSQSTKRNDLIKKMNLYLEGGIKEYWIADTENKQITIYRFKNKDIAAHKNFSSPEKAVSFLFPELKIDLSMVFL